MYQPFNLDGRGAVITGGNGGIGYGMARALLAAGAKVAIWGSNPEKTERARASLAAGCTSKVSASQRGAASGTRATASRRARPSATANCRTSIASPAV